MVNDFLNPQGYPRFAKIKEVQKDTSNIDRYFLCKYQATKTMKTVFRPAQSLTLILEKYGDQNVVTDSLVTLQEKDLEVPKIQKRILVKNNGAQDEIVDLV